MVQASGAHLQLSGISIPLFSFAHDLFHWRCAKGIPFSRTPGTAEGEGSRCVGGCNPSRGLSYKPGEQLLVLFFGAMSESCSPPPSFLSDASGIGVGGIPVPDPSSLGSFCRVLIGPGFLLGHESGIGGGTPTSDTEKDLT